MPVRYNTTFFLVLAHITILCLSNILVQQPIHFFGQATTWGALIYPVIFLLTDLSARLVNSSYARKIVFFAMFPGLIASVLITNWHSYGQLWMMDMQALRIALASFCAYLLGQLADIIFFQYLCNQFRWWLAPMLANVIGSILDTYCFFFIAFYHSQHAFLTHHWVKVATVDLELKLIISLLSVIPLYGLLSQWLIINYFSTLNTSQSQQAITNHNFN